MYKEQSGEGPVPENVTVMTHAGPESVTHSPFGALNLRPGQTVVSLARDTRINYDEHRRFKSAPSDLRVDSAPITNEQVRVVNVRLAPVVGSRSASLHSLVREGVSGMLAPMGSGQQIVPWVHEGDLGPFYLHCLTHEDVVGPINCVAPTQTSNHDYVYALGIAGRYPILPFNMSDRRVRARYGPVQGQLLTESYPVAPRKALETGFSFRFTDIKEAMKEVHTRPIQPVGGS